MLIWINGAFGAGKTLIAHELRRRLGDGQVADPEFLGFALHKMLPARARRDFQDLPQWRSAVLATLIQAEAACDGQLIMRCASYVTITSTKLSAACGQVVSMFGTMP